MTATVFAALPATAQDDEPATVDEGTVGTAGEGMFGPGVKAGWQYVKLRSPHGDAFVAVVYGHGNDNNSKGAIWIVSSWTRVLGAVQGEGPNGNVSKTKPVGIRVLNVQRIDDIIEFQDQNGDGIANLVRSNRPIAPDQVLAHEPVYKAASLVADWQKTNATHTTTTDENGTHVQDYKLTLSASNLPYTKLNKRVNASNSAGDNLLNQVVFTFELKGWKESTTVSIPVWTVSFQRGSGLNVQFSGNRTRDANITKVNVKEGHDITGWDFDPQNTKPGLLLETHLFHGYAPNARTPAWLTGRLIERQLHGLGGLHYRDQNGTDHAADDTASTDADAAPSGSEQVQKIGAIRRLAFGADWQTEGNLTWSDDTDVYPVAGGSNPSGPVPGLVNFQVQGARRLGALGQDRDRPGDGKAVGVVVMGGYSYTYSGGAFTRVVHDPETSVGMVEPSDAGTGGSTGSSPTDSSAGKTRSPGFGFAFLGLALVATLTLVRRRHA